MPEKNENRESRQEDRESRQNQLIDAATTLFFQKAIQIRLFGIF